MWQYQFREQRGRQKEKEGVNTLRDTDIEKKWDDQKKQTRKQQQQQQQQQQRKKDKKKKGKEEQRSERQTTERETKRECHGVYLSN